MCIGLDERILTTANMGQVGEKAREGGKGKERMERQRAKKRKEEEEMMCGHVCIGRTPERRDGGPSGTFMTASTSFSGTVDGNRFKQSYVEDDIVNRQLHGPEKRNSSEY